MKWYVKDTAGLYLDVWGGPALPGEQSRPRWVTREDATTFTRRHLAYAAAGKYPSATVVRVAKARPKIEVVSAPGDICGGTRKCPGCRACS
jgi:hypothetical protein